MSDVQAMARKLYQMGKKGFAVNYQDNEHMKKCARIMLNQMNMIGTLRTENADLQERVTNLEEELAIMREDDPDGRDGSFPDDDTGAPWEAAAPGEAAEDFWEDMWP